jgi:FkbM family methyltransferase
MNSNEAHLKKEVTEAGFRPTIFPFVVWNIRRLIWPFIRQYHFFQVEKLAETQGRLDETLAQLARLTDEFGRFKLAQDKRLTDELGKLKAAQNEILTDELGKLKAVQDERLTDELGRLKAAQNEILTDELGKLKAVQNERLTDELGRLKAAQNERLTDELGRLKAAQNEQASRFNFASLELRSDLAAVINRHGRLTEHLDSVKADHVALRQELARLQDVLATELADRQSALATHLANHESALNEQLAGLNARQLELKSDLVAIVDREGRLDERINGLDADRASLRAEVTGFSERQKIFPSSAEPGVFLLKAGDLVSDFVAHNHTWDAHVVAVIKDIGLTKKGMAIDVGAHLGMVSAVMARHFAQVVSFEPNSFNYRLLVANMSINRLFNVECLNGALYSKPALLSLGKPDQQEIPLARDEYGEFDGLGATNLGAYTFTEDGTGLFSTKARTLDSYGFTDVAFIKIDAQGADGEVIRGAVETIRRCRPVIIFEWEAYLAANFASSLEEIVRLLEGLDYQVDILKRTNDKQTDFLALPRARTAPAERMAEGTSGDITASVSAGKEEAVRA